MFPRTWYAGNPLVYAPALLLQDIAYSYRAWITLIKLLYACFSTSKIKPDIHQGERLCGRLLPSVPLVSEKNPSRRFGEQAKLRLLRPGTRDPVPETRYRRPLQGGLRSRL